MYTVYYEDMAVSVQKEVFIRLQLMPFQHIDNDIFMDILRGHIAECEKTLINELKPSDFL